MNDYSEEGSNENSNVRYKRFISNLMYETPGGARFTQDSPILPPVWSGYALNPLEQQELILTIDNNSGTGHTARELRKMLNELRKKRPMVAPEVERKSARVSYIPGQIAVKLYFDEMMRTVLPLTPWWHEMYNNMQNIAKKAVRGYKPADWSLFPQPDEMRERDLTFALMLMRREIDPRINEKEFWTTIFRETDKKESAAEVEATKAYIRAIPSELMWLIRIGGIIYDSIETQQPLLSDQSLAYALDRDFNARRNDDPHRIETENQRFERIGKEATEFSEAFDHRRGIARRFLNIYDDWSDKDNYPNIGKIWRVTKNRPVNLAVAKSSLTVKADAARTLFNVSCANITWAVIDSGVDGSHPAFKLTSKEHEAQIRRDLANEGDPDGLAAQIKTRHLSSRVIKTLDFTRLRSFLDIDVDDEQDLSRLEGKKNWLVEMFAKRIAVDDKDGNSPREQALEVVENLYERILKGRDISWQDLEKAIIVRDPPVPNNDHGTHVAGILGADWIEDYDHEDHLALGLRTRRMQGICPDINLIDVRVFKENGLTDEFELLAAVQYLRWMNERAGSMKVHGANMSLSLIHDVRRFACGQTPICDECNEASAAGMVIVAAAGNRGFNMSDMNEISAADSFESVSITDPGNAENVITVGSTHRKRPQEYGVSYFSSRGPTGDGRMKPDLVAPGEKIKGPTPNGRSEFKDGTSMSAPHVSGAAALLMARYSEMIGKPATIKNALCGNTTNLGRERYFQGAGLLDILKAMTNPYPEEK